MCAAIELVVVEWHGEKNARMMKVLKTRRCARYLTPQERFKRQPQLQEKQLSLCRGGTFMPIKYVCMCELSAAELTLCACRLMRVKQHQWNKFVSQHGACSLRRLK